jgi:hypothetical protein
VAKRLTYWILAALVLGVAVGWGVNFTLGDGTPEGGPVGRRWLATCRS